MKEERTALEEFLIDNPELERLEALLDESPGDEVSGL